MSGYLRFFIIFLFFLDSTVFASVGKVSLLKGDAYTQRESQKLALQNGSILEEKDIITTTKDAQMQIIFADKTVITLGSESELKIEEYLNDATKPKAKFKFGEGSFKSITGQIGKTAPENFTLETKTATIGIRGTTIQGRVGREGDHIACLSGTITVGAIGSPNVVVVPAGKSTFVAPGTPPTPPQNIKPQAGGALSSNGSGPALGEGTPPPNGGGNPPLVPLRDFSSISNRANSDQQLAAQQLAAQQLAAQQLAAQQLAEYYDSANNEYVSWGYWGDIQYNSDTMEITAATTPFSTWVAGVPTPTDSVQYLIANNKQYAYTGHVIGSVIEGNTMGYILNDANNAINLNINFGTSSTITGDLSFKTNLNPALWRGNIAGNTLSPSGFSANILGGGTTGSLAGGFYGPNANSVAGGFSVTKTALSTTAVGSFKATASSDSIVNIPRPQ